MLSHVQIKVKKTSVIKEYLNYFRAFAGNDCSEFEGKKYHQILVIYHEELYDYKTLNAIQSERWIQGELFSRTEIESVSKFWFWTIRNWGVQKCHIFFIDIKNLFVFCPWICYRLLFILNRFATFYNKLTKINGNLYFKNKRVNTEAKTTYGKTLWHFRTFNHSGIKMMIDVKNWDGGKKISKIDNRKVHTFKSINKSQK